MGGGAEGREVQGCAGAWVRGARVRNKTADAWRVKLQREHSRIACCTRYLVPDTGTVYAGFGALGELRGKRVSRAR